VGAGMTYREIIDKAKKHLDEGFNQFSDREIESSQKKFSWSLRMFEQLDLQMQ
jgi:hypothetical protein